MQRFLVCILFLIFINKLCFSQKNNSKKTLSFNFSGYYGFIIPHSKSIIDISDSNPFGINIQLNRYNTKYSAWEQCNCFSKTGIGLLYSNFDEKKILGQAFSTYLSAQPLFFCRKKLFLSINLAAGISYITKVYDEIYNPKNLFFSSHISFLLFSDFILNYKISKKINANISFCYNHISNGGIKLPNKGMNFPTFNFGFEYLVNPVKYPMHKPTSFNRNDEKWIFSFQNFYSIKVLAQTDLFDEKACLITGFSAKTGKRFARMNRFTLGLEFVDDTYIKEKITRNNLDTDHKRASIIIGHDLIVGNFILAINIGIYFYAPYAAEDPVYQKYDLTYNIFKNLSIGVFTKAHRHKAELMGVSLGITL